MERDWIDFTQGFILASIMWIMIIYIILKEINFW